MTIPSFRNRPPIDILIENNYFDSAGRAYKALSWLDFARKDKCVSALEYAALETRLAIEQLIFEQLIVGVGTTLEASIYKKCNGSASKLSAVIEKLIPKYERLVEFTKAMVPGHPVTQWDNRKLISYSGKVSNYLHWSGGLDVTVQSRSWFDKGFSVVEESINYVWHGLTTGNASVMAVDKFEPEMRELWELYANNEITLESAVRRADILEPVLEARISARKIKKPE